MVSTILVGDMRRSPRLVRGAGAGGGLGSRPRLRVPNDRGAVGCLTEGGSRVKIHYTRARGAAPDAIGRRRPGTSTVQSTATDVRSHWTARTAGVAARLTPRAGAIESRPHGTRVRDARRACHLDRALGPRLQRSGLGPARDRRDPPWRPRAHRLALPARWRSAGVGPLESPRLGVVVDARAAPRSPRRLEPRLRNNRTAAWLAGALAAALAGCGTTASVNVGKDPSPVKRPK